MPTVAMPITGVILETATTVTTTATTIPATALTNRRTILVYNNGSVTVFLGSSTVTTANGVPLAPAAEKNLELDDGVVLYGRVASGTADVRSLEGA